MPDLFGDVRVALAPVDLPGRELPDQPGQLHAHERASLARSATPKRRAEFTAGRVAARRALGALLGADSAALVSVAILPGRDRGRPKAVRTADGTVLDAWISITHADGIAAAAASRRPVGLDLISVECQPTGFAEEAFGPDELGGWCSVLPCGDEALAVCAAFAAKEAVLKLFGMGMALPLSQVVVVPRGVTWNADATMARAPVDVRLGPTPGGVSIARAAEAVLLRVANRLLVVVEWRGAPTVDCSHER